MSTHLVVGAGPVGTATAALLSERGEHVRLVSRSGRGPVLPGVVPTAADAADAAAVSRLAEGVVAVYNCVNPTEYHRWPAVWPPIAVALLTAAERSGAVLVTTGNLYPYGPVDGPMTEDLPDAGTGEKARVRARMTSDALAAHRAGRLRAVEVRGSDYLGPGRVQSHLTRHLPRILAGRAVQVIGSADQPHSWTYVPDVARALVTVAGRAETWGRVWHVPTNPPRTQREAVHDLCRAAGVPPVRVGVLPHLVLRLGGLVSPSLRALEETRYQFPDPYVLDATRSSEALGIAATRWDEVCARTVEAARTPEATPAAA